MINDVIPKKFYCHWILSGDEIQYDRKMRKTKLLSQKRLKKELEESKG